MYLLGLFIKSEKLEILIIKLSSKDINGFFVSRYKLLLFRNDLWEFDIIVIDLGNVFLEARIALIFINI